MKAYSAEKCCRHFMVGDKTEMIRVYEVIYNTNNIVDNITRILYNYNRIFSNVHKIERNVIAADYMNYDELGNDVRITVTVDEDSMIEIESPEEIKSNISNLIVSKVPSYGKFIVQ